MTSTSQSARRKPPSAERGIPRNQQAELVLLSYLTQGGAWLDDFGVHDFGGENEREVFRAMREIFQAGEEISLVRLALELGEEKRKHIGDGYLAELADGTYYFPGMNIQP